MAIQVWMEEGKAASWKERTMNHEKELRKKAVVTLNPDRRLDSYTPNACTRSRGTLNRCADQLVDVNSSKTSTGVDIKETHIALAGRTKLQIPSPTQIQKQIKERVKPRTKIGIYAIPGRE
jgi:hypothetical protein